MNNSQLVQQVNKELALQLPEKISMEEMQQQLAEYINGLIVNNFEQLVNLLYRIDVNEAKIKALLQTQPGENAGEIIAASIIERQLQKIKTRRSFNTNGDGISEEEKW